MGHACTSIARLNKASGCDALVAPSQAALAFALAALNADNCTNATNATNCTNGTNGTNGTNVTDGTSGIPLNASDFAARAQRVCACVNSGLPCPPSPPPSAPP
eukprot:scaffold72836_cov42-Phaeocystis_antarctica.AAC.1